jgi:hypothetical protein
MSPGERGRDFLERKVATRRVPLRVFQLAAAEVNPGASIVAPGGVTATFFEIGDSEQLIAIACGAVTPTATPTPTSKLVVRRIIAHVL